MHRRSFTSENTLPNATRRARKRVRGNAEARVSALPRFDGDFPVRLFGSAFVRRSAEDDPLRRAHLSQAPRGHAAAHSEAAREMAACRGRRRRDGMRQAALLLYHRDGRRGGAASDSRRVVAGRGNLVRRRRRRREKDGRRRDV